MIWRPSENLSGKFSAGLWWSTDPTETPGKRSNLTFMGIDKLNPSPLNAENINFIETNWAVARETLAKLPDCFQSFNSFNQVISSEMADVINELEPGIHDIIPIKKTWSFGSQSRIHRAYCYINVHRTARTINLEKSNVDRDTRNSDGLEFSILTSLTPETCIVDERAAVGRHLWRDDVVKSQAFMSEHLKEKLQEAGCLGMEFTACTVENV